MSWFHTFSLFLLSSSFTYGFLTIDSTISQSCTTKLDSSSLTHLHEGRQLDQVEYKDIANGLSDILHNVMTMKQRLLQLAPCTIEPCKNGGTCQSNATMDPTRCECKDGFAGSKCEINVNKTCPCNRSLLIPHPNKCQLYYNCSQATSPLPTEYERYPYIPTVPRPAYLHECPFPQLFSAQSLTCQNYTDVSCGTRYETKNKCDYLKEGYQCLGACKVCIYFHPDCEGSSDGIYRNTYVDRPGEQYYECKDGRIVYSGGNPCPFNMAPHNGKCTDLFQIPTHPYWGVGYAKNCRGEPNGNYRGERGGRCDIYYTCANDNTTMSPCPQGKVFDVKTSFCQNPTIVCPPCGSASSGCS